VDQRRVLSTYRADSTVFRIHPGPGARMSEAQRSLQGYLHSRLPAAGFECQGAGGGDGDVGLCPEAVQPLLVSDERFLGT
jgi:hypothetical protein